MRRSLLSCGLVLVIGLLSFGIVGAQDATQPPPEATVTPCGDLENVTANHTSCYGQEVTLTGVIEDLLNVRTFVLGEGAALDDDKVLVINNTGQEFDLRVARDQNVQVIGTVWPSIEEGGLGQIRNNQLTATLEPGVMATEALMPTIEGAAATQEMMPTTEGATATEEMMPTTEGMTATQEMMATPEANMSGDTGTTMPSYDLTAMVLPDEFNNYTIIVINSLDNLTFVEPPPAQ